jgi:Rieske Fe-S protein
MVLTSLAFSVGQLWIGLQSLWKKRHGALPAKRIARVADLPIGGTLVFQYPEAHDDCILIRTAPDKWLAYSQKCTHLSCAVIPRVVEGVIHCPCHEGYFDLETGRNIAGPPPRPLPSIDLSVRGDDIYATGVKWRTT